MKYSAVFLTAVGVSVLAASTAFADVQLTMQNGRVSIKAKDATLRQILTEWARVGQTKIVNIERIPGGPITIELTNVPEEQALSVLMRPLSGYVAAPRATSEPNLSRFDRILVMPTLAAAKQPTTVTASAPASTPTFQTPPANSNVVFQQPQAEPAEEEETPAPSGAARAPVFTTFPQPAPAGAGGPFVVPNQPPAIPQPPQGQAPPQQPAGTSAPMGGVVAPVGVAVPGMIVPVPQQQPGQIASPRRPGGQ